MNLLGNGKRSFILVGLFLLFAFAGLQHEVFAAATCGVPCNNYGTCAAGQACLIPSNQACYTCVTVTNTVNSVTSTLCSIVNTIRLIVGVLAIALFIIGGVLYAVAHFLPTTLDYRKSLIGWSTVMIVGGIIGLIVVIIAPTLVQLFGSLANVASSSNSITSIYGC